MKNVNIVIIGATGDIGSNLTRQFASMGASVVAIGRNEKKLEELRSLGENVYPRAMRGGVAEEVDDLIHWTEDVVGRPDILITSVGKFEMINKNVPSAKFVAQLKTDLVAFVEATVVPIFIFNQYFRKNGGGFIVDISSHAAKSLLPGNLTYAPAKAAVKAFVDNLRKENGSGSKIHITQMVSQLVDTPKNRLTYSQITEAEWATAVQIRDIAQWIADNYNNPTVPTEQFCHSGVVL